MVELESLVQVSVKLHQWFPLWDSAGYEMRELFADEVLPYLAELDRSGAFGTIRETFLDYAREMERGGGRWLNADTERQVLAVVDAVRTTLVPEALVAKLEKLL